jgi:hypothetical protein
VLNIARTANRWLVADIKTPPKGSENSEVRLIGPAPMKWQALRMIYRYVIVPAH